MTSSNYNLCFLALVLCMTNIRSENDFHDHTRITRLCKTNKNNKIKIIKLNNIFLQLKYYNLVIEVIQI